MDAAAAAPALAPVIKRRRKARTVPKVRVYSRHRSDCKWAGDETRLGCDCPKQLAWFREGKLTRVAADTCDGEVAEKKARDMMAGFEAAAKGEPTPIPVGSLTTLLEDAVNTFPMSKQQSNVTAKHCAKLTYELGAFSTFALGKGLVNLGDIKTEHVLAYRNSLVGAQNTRAKKIFRLIGFFKFWVEKAARREGRTRLTHLRPMQVLRSVPPHVAKAEPPAAVNSVRSKTSQELEEARRQIAASEKRLTTAEKNYLEELRYIHRQTERIMAGRVR